MLDRKVANLDDDEEANAGADVAGLAVHASHDVDDALTESDDHAEHWKQAKDNWKPLVLGSQHKTLKDFFISRLGWIFAYVDVVVRAIDVY